MKQATISTIAALTATIFLTFNDIACVLPSPHSIVSSRHSRDVGHQPFVFSGRLVGT